MKVGILLPEVVLLAECEYRKIPGYVSAYAGANGKILLVKSNGDAVYPNEFEWKTTVGSYKYVKLVSDDFVQVTKPVHRLMTQAFYGNPPNDGRIYEPNHKNGDKFDNRPDNLEWMTRAENVQHAYDSGLCQQGLRIDVIDVVCKSTQRYNSLSSLSRVSGIPRNQLREIIAKHRDTPYMGRYLYVLDDSSDKKITRHQSREVIFKDYVTGQTTVVSTAQQASDLTGVKVGTIVLKTRQVLKGERPPTLTSKYVFQPLKDHLVWPDFTVEQALESQKSYTQQ